MADDTNDPGQHASPPAGSLAEEAELHIQGPIRRNLWIIVAVAAVLVAGPFLSRFLEAYRAVVLEVRGDEMFIALAGLPPEWVDRIEVEPGRIIEKSHWSWSPEPVPAGPGDKEMLALHERYASSWSGTVVEVVPPPTRDAFATVVVETAGGERLKLSTSTLSLDGAKVGQHVVKEPHSWDPVLTD